MLTITNDFMTHDFLDCAADKHRHFVKEYPYSQMEESQYFGVARLLAVKIKDDIWDLQTSMSDVTIVN